MTTIITEYNKLPIIINGIEINPNEDGMYCLNDIAKAGGLTGVKAKPSEWDNTTSRHFVKAGKILRLAKTSRNSKTYTTEAGAIAYAMWVSIDFYELVVQTFIIVRNDLTTSRAVVKALHKEKDKAIAEHDVTKAALIEEQQESFIAKSKVKMLKDKQFKTLSDICLLHGLPSVRKFTAYLHSIGAIESKGFGKGKHNIATAKGLTMGFINLKREGNLIKTQLRITELGNDKIAKGITRIRESLNIMQEAA